MKGLLGRKIGMSRVFDEQGAAIAVTLLECGPCPVLQVKTPEKDGYSAIQVGYGEIKEKNAPKPTREHCKKVHAAPVRLMKEFPVDKVEEYKPGEALTVEVFNEVQQVDVTGISKGKGFAGTVKRHNYSRGKETHGNKNHRGPGSIGNHSYPARVWPGKDLPGHCGAQRVTVKNLRVMQIDTEKNMMVVQGSIPGPNGGYLILRESIYGKG